MARHDGFPEFGDLTFDQAGNIYGTASGGGILTNGVVFKLTRSGSGWTDKAKVSGLAYENGDGSAVVIDSDYFDKPRNASSPSAGPFETPGLGSLKLKVW